MDMQNGLNGAYQYTELIEKINQRIKAYHQTNLPVIYVQHTDAELPYGSEAWQLDAKITRSPTDRVFLKYHSDSFFETGLKSYLRHRNLQSIEVCGLQTEYCVDTALRVGHHLGFKMSILAGLSSTFDNELLPAIKIRAHHESIWQGSFAEVLSNKS
ncbi:isochorismatase family protein [Loigolactobacillus backii]|uniref:isochorismatase family protein n=2 Tax=Loigolactobacillus backii TaxID=375175 RepID=UPI0021E760CF|nr:isochorismatase family protein [Loigolactobacillus backii]